MQAKCYYVADLAAPGVLSSAAPQKCTLPAAFAYVKTVNFSIEPIVKVDQALRVVAIGSLNYVLHRCPRP